MIYPTLLAILVSAPSILGKSFIGNHLVGILFNSSANIMAVDCRLVPKSAYTGKYVHCRTLPVGLSIFLSAVFFIQMLYYTGLAELCSIRKPISQLIIGQLTGNKRCINQQIQAWWRKNGLQSNTVIAQCDGRQQTHSTNTEMEVANTIMTRSATCKHLQSLRH